MGCDIHLFIEGKKSLYGEKRWVSLDKWTYSPNYAAETFEPEINCEHVYSRNYYLFAVLANVLNEDKTKYISNPKGIPPNLSKLVKRKLYIHRDNGDSYHSHSWLTLGELKKFKNKMETLIDTDKTDEFQFIVLNPLISILENKKNNVPWMYDSGDSDIRIVFWFDSH